MSAMSTRQWDAMRQRRARALANQRVQNEAIMARAIMAACPELTRDQALREAARIVRRNELDPLRRGEAGVA